MFTTDFLPEIDGYNFNNAFRTDAEEKKKVRDLFNKGVPIAAGILGPIIASISPLVIATIGPVFALIGPFLPFLPIFAPLIAEKICDSLSNAIADDVHGYCGGMAYSSADYYRLNWVLPRGSTDLPKRQKDGGSLGSENLRNYIWTRLMDSNFGDVDKWILWTVMNKLFGDYGQSWLNDQCKSELPKIEAKIRNGDAWPIGLIGKSANLSDSHVVVAITFQKLSENKFTIGIYDNNHPNQTCNLNIDLSGSFPVITEDTPSAKKWAAIFLTSYSPASPPPAMIATSKLDLIPNSFTGQGMPILANFSSKYIGYGPSADLHLAVGDKIWFEGEEDISTNAKLNEGDARSAISPGIEFSFWQATTFALFPKVALFNKALDKPGISKAYKILANADGSMIEPKIFKVTPRIRIDLSTGTPCWSPFAEYTRVTCSPNGLDLSNIIGTVSITGYFWNVSGDVIFSANTESTIIINPPANKTVIVDLTVSLSDGTEAYGKASYITLDQAFAERLYHYCQMAHIIILPPIIHFPVRPIDPVPSDWFNRPEVKSSVNPILLLEQFSSMIKNMEEIIKIKPNLGRNA